MIIKSWKNLSKKRKKLIIIIASFTLLVMAACYTVLIAPLLEREQWVYKEATVERGTLTVGVTESGTLEYGITNIEYDLDLDIDDDDDDDDDEEEISKYLKIEEIYVAAGQRISENDALIKFSEDSVSDVRRYLESAVVDAKSDYAQAEADYNLAVLQAQTDYDISLVTAKYADSIYDTSSADISNQITLLQVQIEQCKANISTLEEKVEEAQEDYDDVLEDYLAAKETIDTYSVEDSSTVNYMAYQNEYLTNQTKYQNALDALEQAEQNVTDNAEKITSLEKQLAELSSKAAIDQLETSKTYTENIISGDNAEIIYNAEVESQKETLEEEKETLDAVQEQLDKFEAFVGDDGILYSDGAGIVTAVNCEESDSLTEMATLISYASPSDMTISVDITQEDIVDMSVGDIVDITFTAYEDVSYEGIIESMETTATARTSNTISYTVVISVQGDTDALYGGMTADIVFIKQKLEDVLYVSRKAIVEEDGKTYVYVETSSGGRELREVETGETNGVDIVITSGLEEGDTIYLASRVSSEDDVTSEDSSTTDTDSSDTSSDSAVQEGSPGDDMGGRGMENGGGRSGGMGNSGGPMGNRQ
ncbi:MAG: HlyD family efflux transporter periplasmic adaptor subunit [Lachnospiraceae bacterium]|nr:HlyD family efflux transporter periplasmic adaptor subunit [Lachnospiraceae bacterium]